MEQIKLELEKALNESFPMRGLNNDWLHAGNFYVNDKKYAFYGQYSQITCRCMESDSYANHWFERHYINAINKWIIGDVVG
jgi:hypothetical protein